MDKDGSKYYRYCHEGIPSSLPVLANHDFHYLPAVIEEEDEEDVVSDAHTDLTDYSDNFEFNYTPRVTFKMSLSSESIDKCLQPPKSPLKSALKSNAKLYHQEGLGLKKVPKSDIDDLQKQLDYEKWLSRRCSMASTILPDHAVTQLYCFDAERNGGMWHEAARFVKYEELVEGIDTMWSPPHVPFLPFSAVISLRKLIESNNAMCALDVDGSNFGEICHSTVSELESAGSLDIEDGNNLCSFLTFRRDHAKNNTTKYNWIRKITGTGREGVASLFQREPPSRSCSTGAIDASRQQRLEQYGRAYDSFSHREAVSPGPNNGVNPLPDLDESPRKHSDFLAPSSNSSFKSASSGLRVPEYQPLLTVPSDSFLQKSSFQSFENLSTSDDSDTDSGIPDNSQCIQILVGRASIFKTTKFIFIRLNNLLIDRHLTKKRFPIKFFILILGPRENNETFYEIGRAMASLCANQQFLANLYKLTSKDDLLLGLDAVLNESMIIPPIEIDSPDVFNSAEYEKVYKRTRFRKKMRPKKSSTMPKIVEEKEQLDFSTSQITVAKDYSSDKHKFFRGFIMDAKNLTKRYSSDFTDVMKGKQLAFVTIICLYLSLLPPTITFAKILETFTGKSLGIMEAFMSTCLCGIIWGLFSAQPFLIQGVTGPIMIFESSYYKLCNFIELDYIEVRFYTGIVILILSLLTNMFDGTRLLKYVTKFTEEIFCALIALIYVAETVHYMYHEYHDNPSRDFHYYKNFTIHCDDHGSCDVPRPNAGILAAFVIFFCTSISLFLYFLRFSKYLGRSLRNTLADFNILITLSLSILLIYIFIPTGILDTVHVPEIPTWTNPKLRQYGWIVWPRFDDLNRVLMHVSAAVVGGIMVFVLLFAETSMVEMLLEDNEKKLIKPGGVNWDLMVMSMCSIVASLFGLPWVCVSGVQTIDHVKGMSYMKKTAPGAKPVVDRVVENRVTTICVALLFGATAFMGRFLQYIPVSCLFGVFMYLGTVSMLETTLFNGLLNVLHFGKNFRHTESDLNVKANRIRFYRFLQLVGLVWIYMVKQVSVLAVLFPFVFIAFILCRQFILPLIYNDEELYALDQQDQAISVDDEEQNKNEVCL